MISSFIAAHQQGKSKYKNDIVTMETKGRGVELGKVFAFLEHVPARAIHYAASAASLGEYVRIAWLEWYGSMAQPSASATAQPLEKRPCTHIGQHNQQV